MLVLLQSLRFQLRVDLAGLWVGSQGAAKEEDVRLRPVDGVMDPAAGLLYSDATPLALGEEAVLGEGLGQVLGEDDVPVLVVLVGVLFGVFDAVGAHVGLLRGRLEQAEYQSIQAMRIGIISHFARARPRRHAVASGRRTDGKSSHPLKRKRKRFRPSPQFMLELP